MHLYKVIILFVISFLAIVLYKNSNSFNSNDFDISKARSNLEKYKNDNKVSFLDHDTEIENHKNEKDRLKDIRASSYLVYDLNSGETLLGRDTHIRYPLASITKLMTAYVADVFCKDNLKEKLDALLIASDNIAADDIASSCPNYEGFIKIMNDEAVKNKLRMTFINPSGLDINNETEASNYGDALSVAKLIEMLHKNNQMLLEHTTREVYNSIKNTNSHVNSFPFLVGSKTGFTDAAGGNLVTMYEVLPGKKVALVVFGSTKEDRFADTFILLKYYLNNLK